MTSVIPLSQFNPDVKNKIVKFDISAAAAIFLWLAAPGVAQ